MFDLARSSTSINDHIALVRHSLRALMTSNTRICNHLALLVFLVIVTACSPKDQAPATGDPELDRLAAIAEGVEIIRDDFGVPHIYAETDADAVFGMLYAQAEDDFPRIERNYIWATGRLAEVDGEEAIYSDVRAHLYMTVDEAKAAYASAPDWLQALCDAYADGLNYFLATHPAVSYTHLTLPTNREV